MPEGPWLLVIVTVLIALAFDFLNGMNDAANSIATVVSTRVLSPRQAVVWAALFNFVAAFGFGVHVASTIGRGIVDAAVVTPPLVLAALIGAVLWTHACTRLGLPISVSHSLIGGLAGAGVARGGVDALVGTGLAKVGLFIVLSPLIGMLLATGLMIALSWLLRHSNPWRADASFRVGQLLSSAAFSLGHGTNDAQKTMGIIAVLLFSAGYLGSEFYVPVWVILAAHAAIALGTLMGGWRVIRTLGVGLTDLRPAGGFCAETAGAAVLFATSVAGIPVSTTHTVTGAIVGVGATRRVSAVRWGVARGIVTAWVLTIPVSGLVGAVSYLTLGRWLEG